MRGLWRDPIHLPRHWRAILTAVEVAGPVTLSVLPFFWDENAGHQQLLVRIAVATAVLTFVAVIVLKVVEHWGDREKRFVDALLRHLGNEMWQKHPQKLHGPIERHRITLFRLKKRRMLPRKLQRKWTHVLCPCTRSPLSGRRPRRRFYVHEHFQECCEGVSGLIFANGQRSIVTAQLPDLRGAGVTEQTYSEYARLTNDTVEKVKTENYYSRIIGGVTIYKDGMRWGVLVFDSSDAEAITTKDLEHETTKRALSLLVDFLP